MTSKVFAFFKACIVRLLDWFDASMCGKYYNKFSARCHKLYCGSAISRFFHISSSRDYLKNSFFGKLILLPEKILLFLQNRLSAPIERQVQNSMICSAFSKWADTSVRLYGIALWGFSLPFFLQNLFARESVILSLAVFILGGCLIVINRSLRQLFGGSLLVKWMMELFTEIDETTHPCGACKRTQMIFAFLLGVLLSFVCYLFGIKLFAVVCVGILAAAFLIRYLHLGVFMTIVLSPVLPTMVLVALSFLCAAVFCVHVIADKDFRFAKNPMNLFVVFFALALLWGCVNSFAVFASVSQVAVHLSFILFYFVVVNTIRTKKQWSALIKLFLLSAFVVALYGVMQNFMGVQGSESWLDEDMFEGIRVRVYSFFNNPNVLGEFLVLSIPLTAAMLWGKMKGEHKTLFGFILLSMAACMIFTWSRGAWLGVFFACALFFVIMDKRWVFLGVLALLLLPLLMVLSGNTTILERLLSVGNTADTSTAYRVSIWQASVQMIRDFWVSGIGIGSEAFKSVYPVYSLAGADFALHSHNLYLQVWVEMGIVGIVALLSMVLMFVKQVFSNAVIGIHRTDSHAKLVIALGAGVLGFLLQGLTDYVWYNYKILMIFWIFLALGISGVNLIASPICKEEETT